MSSRGLDVRYFSFLLIVAVCTALMGLSVTTINADDAPWKLHTITSGPRGADGVDLADVNGDGRADVTSAWEQAGIVTVSLHPGSAVSAPWPTVTVGSGLGGVEDAIFADVDRDGRIDVISACECRKVVIHFAPRDPSQILNPAAWSSTVITGSVGIHRWIKVAVTDIDQDRRLDIVGGGKRDNSPATIGWFRAPADPRNGSAWTYTLMSQVGWTMSLLPLDVDNDKDVDVVLSDRTPIRNPDGTIRRDLRGSRWLENTDRGASWTNHAIGFGQGEHKFLHVVDFDRDGDPDVLDGVSADTYNKTFFRRNSGNWLLWEETPIPQPDGVGHYQDVKTGDMDLDGDTDLVFSYSHADGNLSGVVMMAATPGQDRKRVEISGAPGTKYDNVQLYDVDGDRDLDVITSEQVDQLGVVWYENPAR